MTKKRREYDKVELAGWLKNGVFQQPVRETRGQGIYAIMQPSLAALGCCS